jgi:SNF family Na+-dependent transporter
MITLLGMPMLLMEFSFGQYFGIGSLSIFKQVCPIFQGFCPCIVYNCASFLSDGSKILRQITVSAEAEAV